MYKNQAANTQSEGITEALWHFVHLFSIFTPDDRSHCCTNVLLQNALLKVKPHVVCLDKAGLCQCWSESLSL